jgi:23S rRNA (adenine-N6)-dimethyltransferase
MRRSIHYAQNFLRSGPYLADLVSNTSIAADDMVLDIGAGSGVLTKLLARKAKEVVAIETDWRLAAGLQTRFADMPNVHIVSGDFLTMSLPSGSYKVFANMPFNQTSAIVHKLVDTPRPPEDCYLVMQQEAAEKFAGTPERQSLFSATHTPWFEMKIIYQFHPKNFQPQPNVDIVLLRCRPRLHPAIPVRHRAQYEDLIAYVFNHANPSVLPALTKLFTPRQFAEATASLGPYVTARPSRLPAGAWYDLFHSLQQHARPEQVRIIRGSADRLHREAESIEKYHRTRLSKDWRREAGGIG